MPGYNGHKAVSLLAAQKSYLTLSNALLASTT